jgi:protoporphyrinogen oxidase
MKVAVIGTGAAGLAATSALVKAGVEVTTFEACGEAGGHARCYRKDGFTLDTGAQFMAKVCKTQIRLCHELRLGDQIMPFALMASSDLSGGVAGVGDRAEITCEGKLAAPWCLTC